MKSLLSCTEDALNHCDPFCQFVCFGGIHFVDILHDEVVHKQRQSFLQQIQFRLSAHFEENRLDRDIGAVQEQSQQNVPQEAHQSAIHLGELDRLEYGQRQSLLDYYVNHQFGQMGRLQRR